MNAYRTALHAVPLAGQAVLTRWIRRAQMFDDSKAHSARVRQPDADRETGGDISAIFRMLSQRADVET